MSIKSLLFCIMIGFSLTNGQDFIKIKNNQFILNGSEFNFFGFNAYYLLTQTAYGKKYIVDEVFDAANEIGAKVVRTWAFFDSDSPEDPAVIRYSPESYNEDALNSLDYVVYSAKKKNIKLILSLLNSNPEYGGIPQYLRWGKKALNKELTRNDFFVNDTLKGWYKDYLFTLLNRVNTFTNIPYKDEPAVFSFELINEAVNPGMSPSIITNWYKEMAIYFKSIDLNHLVTTGETGEDDDNSQYSDVNLFYNSSGFLFNGSKGTSFANNIAIPGIDYGSFHLYTDGWGLHPAAGINWIKEHMFISETFNKPSLLSEFGCRENKPEVYEKWLAQVSTLNCRSALIWHFIHPDVNNKDSYGFNMEDQNIIKVIKDFVSGLNIPVTVPVLPLNANLHQNYPNPFNPVTTIRYDLDKDDNILLEIYNSLGELVGVLDEGFKRKGSYELTLSFNSVVYSSGVYLYTLTTSEGKITKKLLLLK